ncbi:MAG: hypothetical protein LBB52_04505 [Desulfovibrio sp.]|jgi:predicted nucleic acid-binding protein|nr:hypothetical protein [Desulfovibrio sp.]
MFLLDTVVLSELREKDRNPGLIAWMRDKRSSDLLICVVSIGEIAKGIILIRAFSGHDGNFVVHAAHAFGFQRDFFGKPGLGFF